MRNNGRTQSGKAIIAEWNNTISYQCDRNNLFNCCALIQEVPPTSTISPGTRSAAGIIEKQPAGENKCLTLIMKNLKELIKVSTVTMTSILSCYRGNKTPTNLQYGNKRYKIRSIPWTLHTKKYYRSYAKTFSSLYSKLRKMKNMTPK